MTRANTLTGTRLSSGVSAGGRPRGSRAGGTVARILDGAVELLNREGGDAVTTNHIAAHLGMSPGNLYYHFRNREEIVRAIFPRIVEEGLRATDASAPTLTAREFGDRHVQGIHTLWRHRFFFRDLNQLLARDEELAAAYRDYHRGLRAQYRAIFERLIAQGSMRAPRPAADLDRVVTDSIVVWFAWIPYLTSLRPRPDIAPRDVVEGALHSFLVVAPLLESGFASESRAVIEEHGRPRHRRP